MTGPEHVYIVETIENRPGNLGPALMLAEHIRENSKGRHSLYRRVHSMTCPVCADAGHSGRPVVTYYADPEGLEYRFVPPRRVQREPYPVKIPATAHQLPEAPSPCFTECARCATTFLLLSVASGAETRYWSQMYLQPTIQSTYAPHPETGDPLVTHEVVHSSPLAAMINHARRK